MGRLRALRIMLYDDDSKLNKVFDSIIQVLIVLSLINLTISTLPELTDRTKYISNIVETVCVIVFIFEYVIRIVTAKYKLKYLFSFYGLVDLVSILPFFFVGYSELLPIKTFKVLRVFRALKLVRYNLALQRLNIVYKMIKEELILFGMVAFITLFLASCGIYIFEHEAQPEKFASIIHSAWWSVVTLTTVGYGDIYPITQGGKVFSGLVILVGVGIVAIPSGLFASALGKAREIQEQIENE